MELFEADDFETAAHPAQFLPQRLELVGVLRNHAQLLLIQALPVRFEGPDQLLDGAQVLRNLFLRAILVV